MGRGEETRKGAYEVVETGSGCFVIDAVSCGFENTKSFVHLMFPWFAGVFDQNPEGDFVRNGVLGSVSHLPGEGRSPAHDDKVGRSPSCLIDWIPACAGMSGVEIITDQGSGLLYTRNNRILRQLSGCRITIPVFYLLA